MSIGREATFLRDRFCFCVPAASSRTQSVCALRHGCTRFVHVSCCCVLDDTGRGRYDLPAHSAIWEK